MSVNLETFPTGKHAILAAYIDKSPGRSAYRDPFAPGAAPVPRKHRERQPMRTSPSEAAERVSAQAAAAILGLPVRTTGPISSPRRNPRCGQDRPPLDIRYREIATAGQTERARDMAKRKAPPGCYWRGNTLWARTQVRGREVRWSLHTSDPAIARTQYQAGRERLIGDAHHGGSPRGFVEAMEGWSRWIERRARPKTVQRYACSLDQLKDFLDGKRLSEIDGRFIAEIIRARAADGVSNATIKRDLVAVSSVLNYAIDQGWLESNPVLARMRRIEERRDPITLPRPEDIALVIERAPGMVKDAGAGRHGDRSPPGRATAGAA